MARLRTDGLPVAITPEDILTRKVIADAQISFDGNSIAFVVGDCFKEKIGKAKSNIWLADVGSGTSRQFTGGAGTDNFPRWSPDGRKLAFLSDRSENRLVQVYLIDREGGEALQLTDIRGEIAGFAWSPSGKEIAFLMYDPETEEDRARMEKSGGAIEFEKFHKFCRIWTVDVQNKSLRKVTGDYQVWEFCWCPDGSCFAAIVADEPYEWSWHIARLAVIPVDRGAPRVLYDAKPKQLGGLLWSQDGRSIYFLSATLSDRPLVGGDLFRISASGSETEPTNLTNDNLGSVHYAKWNSTDRLIVLSVNNAKTIFTLVKLSGPKQVEVTTLYEGEVGVIGGLLFTSQPMFSCADNGSIAVVREDLYSPQEIWYGKMSEASISWKQLTDLNKPLKKYSNICAEMVEWKSFDGLNIQGFLYHPPRQENEPLPLIVRPHGGPSLGYGCRFELEPRYYASHGYAVLLPNPRGSMGRGVKFLEMNRGNIEGKDFKDIMAGVDYCIEEQWADPKNLFVYGGSYGGYLVAWTVSQTQRFNAAVMDYGISNLLSCHGGEWNTYWEVFQFDIDPYKQSDLFNKKSPIYYARNVKTPTLIIHGKEDPCVPVEQAHEFFRALKELGVQTELVVYPREGHGYQERAHMIDSFQRHLNWFNEHMKHHES
jgi:dipeptidyl aminopeptidase/acylaminoacyl peptidase